MSPPGGLGRFSRWQPSNNKDGSGEATASPTNDMPTKDDTNINDPMDFSTTVDTGTMDSSNSWMAYNNFDVSFDGGQNDLDLALDMSSFMATTSTTSTTMNHDNESVPAVGVDASTMESYSFLDSKMPETATASATNDGGGGGNNASGGLRIMSRKNVLARDPPRASTSSKTQDEVVNSNDSGTHTLGHPTHSNTNTSTEVEKDTNDPSPPTDSPDEPSAFTAAPLAAKAPNVLPSDLANKTQVDVNYTSATDPNPTFTGGLMSSLQEEDKPDGKDSHPMELDVLPTKDPNNVGHPASASITPNVAHPPTDKPVTTATGAVSFQRQEPSKGVAFLPAESFETDHQDVRIIPGMTPMSNRRPPTVTPAGSNMTSTATIKTPSSSRPPSGVANHQQGNQSSSLAPRTPGPQPLKQQGGMVGNNSLHASTTATPKDSTQPSRFASVVTPSDRQSAAAAKNSSSALTPRLLHAGVGIENVDFEEKENTQPSITASPSKVATQNDDADAASILDDDQANWTFEDYYAQFLLDIRDLSDLQETNYSKLREMQGDFATAYAETLQDQAKLLDLVSQFEGIAVVTEELMRDVVSLADRHVVG